MGERIRLGQGGRCIGQGGEPGIRTKHYRYDEEPTGINVCTPGSAAISGSPSMGSTVKDVAEWEGNLWALATTRRKPARALDVGAEQGERATRDHRAAENARSAAAGMPILPGATERTTFGDMTTYKTATKMADAVAFYEAEMPWPVVTRGRHEHGRIPQHSCSPKTIRRRRS